MAAIDLLILTSLLIVLLTVSFFALYHLWWRSREEQGEACLPPGPRGLPLLGYLPFLNPDLHRCFADLARIHGPVMQLHLGSKLCVVLSSPPAVKEALKDHDAIFANHDVPSVALATPFGRNDMLFAPYGPCWRFLRKVTVRELLNPATLEGLSTVRRREVRRMLEEVRGKAGEVVNVRELVFAVVLNVTTTMLWGGKVAKEGEALGREFRQVIVVFLEVLGALNVSDFFPALAWLDLQGLARRLRRLWAWMDRILDGIIEQRRRVVEDGGEGDGAAAGAEKSRDFLQVMLDLLERGDPQAPLTLDQVKALFVDLVAGATDTTTTIVEWAMAELLCNPQKMTKAKEEIAAVVGKDGTIEESHLPKLHYLVAVVKEVLRLHPVLPLLVPHLSSSSCTINGYRIPKGAKVFINIWAIHRDPQFWEHAAMFEPERFLNASLKSDFTGNNFNYLPFGAGRRICVGLPLGEKMVMFILASLLHLADWTLPKGVKMDLGEKFGILMKKEEALVAIPMVR